MMLPIESLLGGLTGLVGSITTGIMNFKMKKLELEKDKLNNAHEIARISAETTAMIQEKEAEIRVVATEYEGKENLIDAESFQVGQKALVNKDDSKIYNTIDKLIEGSTGKFRIVSKSIGIILLFLISIVEIMRKSIRPGLTVFYTVTSAYICYTCFKIMTSGGTSLPPDKLYIILDQCVSATIYLTITIVTFWFSDRSAGKFIREHLAKKNK